MIGKVDRAVAVAERYTSKIPEDKHEAPFLIVHIPGDQSVTSLNKSNICISHHVETMHSSPFAQAFAYK